MRLPLALISLTTSLALLGACSADEITSPAKNTLDVNAPSAAVSSDPCAPRGNEGWNFTARLYQGRAGGSDFTWDCLYMFDPTFANDHLLVNWNAEFDRYRLENGSNPPYIQACYSNLWNGDVAGGSGQSSYIKLCVSPTCASWINQPWNPNSMCSGLYEVVAWFGRIFHDRYLIVSPYAIPTKNQ